MPRQPILTVLGDVESTAIVPRGEGRPDEVLTFILCPDCNTRVRHSNVTNYPDNGIACGCRDKVWSMQPVTNIPRQPKPTVASKGEQ